MNRRRFCTLVLGSMTTVYSGCVGETPTQKNHTQTDIQSRMTITIENGSFEPDVIRAGADQSIELTFENHDTREYRLISADIDNFTREIRENDTVRIDVEIPAKPGTYRIGLSEYSGTVRLEAISEELLEGCGNG